MNTTATREAHSNVPAVLSEDELTKELIREIMELTSDERKELMRLWQEIKK